jgi:hypothetical protein
METTESISALGVTGGSVEQTAAPALDQTLFRSEMFRISRQAGVYLAGTVFMLVRSYLFKIYVARQRGRGDRASWAE